MCPKPHASVARNRSEFLVRMIVGNMVLADE